MVGVVPTEKRSCEPTLRCRLPTSQEKRLQNENFLPSTLTWDFQPPGLRGECLFKSPSLWHFVTQPELRHTDMVSHPELSLCIHAGLWFLSQPGYELLL